MSHGSKKKQQKKAVRITVRVGRREAARNKIYR